jgi:hypothetical protein
MLNKPGHWARSESRKILRKVCQIKDAAVQTLVLSG